MEAMTTTQEVVEIERFAARLYSGDKEATHEFTRKGWTGFGKQAGLPVLTAVLSQSTQTTAILFACRILTECITQMLHSTDALVVFLTTLLGEAVRRSGELAASAVRAMCAVAGTTMKRSYRHAPPVRSMVDQLAASVAATGTTLETTYQVTVACHVLDEVVCAMGQRRFSHVAEDVSDARQFRDSQLHGIFSAAAAAVKRQRVQWEVGSPSAATLSAALELMDKVLSYDFECVVCGERTDDSRASSAAVIPSSWNASLTDKALMDRLWTLLNTTTPGRGSTNVPCALPPYRTILRLLRTFCGLQPDKFVVAGSSAAACLEARRRWLETVLLQSHVVIERGAHQDDEDVLLDLSQLLASVKPGYTIDELLKNDNFGNWATSLLHFTEQCLEKNATADSTAIGQAVAVLLDTWTRLCGAAVGYTNIRTNFLTEYGAKVLRQYLAHSVLGRVEWYARGASAAIRGAGGGGDAGFAPASYPLDDDSAGIGAEMAIAVDLAAYVGEAEADVKGASSRWRLLAEAVNFQFGRFERAIVTANEPDTLSPVEGSAWALQLAAACIASDNAGSGLTDAAGTSPNASRTAAANALGSLVVEAFLLVNYSLRRDTRLAAVPSIAVRSHFEEAAVAFLSTVTTRFILQKGNSRSERALAELIRGRLEQCGLMQPGVELAAYLLDMTAHKVWDVLSAANIRVRGRTAALTLLEKITDAPSAIRVLKDAAPAHRWWFSSLVPAALPESLRLAEGPVEAEQVRARYQYVRCVGRITLNGIATTDTARPVPELAELLGAVVGVMQHADSATQAQLVGALVDLRGVLSCAGRRPYRNIYNATQPLLVPLLQSIAATAQASCNVPLVHALRLVEELAHNRNQRIFFGANNPAPYVLFRDVAACIGSVAPLVTGAFAHASSFNPNTNRHEDVSSDEEEWGWTCLEIVLRVGHHVLHGDYCNLGVFRLYGDTSLESLVQTTWSLLAQRRYAELAVRPSALQSAIAFVNELCNEFFTSVWCCADADGVRSVEGLIEATAFPADVSVLPSQAAALEALGRLVDACLLPTQEAVALSKALADADPVMFKRLLSTCLEWALAPPRSATKGSEVGASLFQLVGVLGKLLHLVVLRDGEGLAAVQEFFSSRCSSASMAAAVTRAFTVAGQAFTAIDSCSRPVVIDRTRTDAAEALAAALQRNF